MKNVYRCGISTVVLTLILISWGCINPFQSNRERSSTAAADGGAVVGSLTIGTSGGVTAQTITPGTDLKSLISSYRVEFTDHADGEADFNVDPYVEGDTIDNIPVGNWTITVVGRDGSGDDIATAVPDSGNPVYVFPGLSIATTLYPIESSASGTLAWTLAFPTADVDGATVTVDRWPIGGGDETTLTQGTEYTANFSTGSLELNTTLNSGKYFVTIEFWKTVDAGTEYHPPVSEIVQIYDHLTSSETTTLTTADFTQPPTAPTGLSATPISSTEIQLTWTDTSNTESGFEVERATNGGSFETLTTTLPAGSEGYDDGTIDTSVHYEYRVRSFNTFGPSSAWSATAIVPATPTISGITDGETYHEATTVTISGEAGATIEYSTNGGIDWISYIGGVVLDTNGTYAISARQTDAFGNTSANASTISVEIGMAGTVKWSVSTDGAIDPCPAISAEGTVVYVNAGNDIIALNTHDGTELWSYTFTNSASSPTIGANGHVYAGSYDYSVNALEPSNGTLIWSINTGGEVHSMPAVGADGTIYVGSWDNKIYALNPSDGSEVWTFTTAGKVWRSPAIGTDGTLYVGSADNKIYALDPGDGSEVWAFITAGEVFTAPIIAGDGTIYAAGGGGVYALDPNPSSSSGSANWTFNSVYGTGLSLAIGVDGTIFRGASDNAVHALDPSVNPANRVKWSFTTGNWVLSAPAIGADGTVYIGSTDGKLYALDPVNGSEFWHLTLSGLSGGPAIGADGTVYVLAGGVFYAIWGNSNGLADTPWPMVGQNVAHTGLAE